MDKMLIACGCKVCYTCSRNAVLIDTGLGVSNIKEIVDSLTELPIIVVTTHVHWDHIGGHKHFEIIAVLFKAFLKCFYMMKILLT